MRGASALPYNVIEDDLFVACGGIREAEKHYVGLLPGGIACFFANESNGWLPRKVQCSEHFCFYHTSYACSKI